MPNPQPAPNPQPSSKPPGQVIRPDFPQWQRKPPPASGHGRLGAFGRLLGRFSLPLALLWPEPLADGTLPEWEHQTPQDDYERWLQEEARRLYLEDPQSRPQLEREYRDQLEQHRSEPAPAPAPDNTRVDRPKCYVLPLTFTTPTLGTVTEMRRQLALQQTVLNSKNPCQAAADLAKYPFNKPIGERERPRARERYIQANAARLAAISPALSMDAALVLARTAAIGKDAIHTLDMVAGGNPLVFSGLGGRSENRSIGGQWGPGGKAGQLDAYAQNQCQNGCPVMQTLLTAI